MIAIQSKHRFKSIKEFQFIPDKQVGCGSFGVVKLARHRITTRMFAVKIVVLMLFRSRLKISLLRPKSNFFRERLPFIALSTILTLSSCGILFSKTIVFTWLWIMLKTEISSTIKILKLPSLNLKLFDFLVRLCRGSATCIKIISSIAT